MIKVIIFDFDGVIADSFYCFYPMIKNALASVDISISEEQYRNLFLDNIHQGFKNLINDDKKYEKFSQYRKKHYSDYYKPSVFDGARDFLIKTKSKYKMAIASSGHKETILNTLRTNNMLNFFDTIIATDEYTKENMIKKILGKFKTKPKEAVIITDTVGDIKIAQKIGLKTIAVTRGYHSRKTLESAKPDLIADLFNEIDFSSF